jgi:hypothetical protein
VWVAAVAIVCFGSTVRAQLIYSFESPASNPDGFIPNGAGTTISQDTFGATDGTHSMKVSAVSGATFVGALTGSIPAPLNNPPGVDAIKFDMTMGPNDAFTGAFDVVGITVFGVNAPLGQVGLQAQFGSLIHVDGKSPGTYLNQLIPLTSATNPLTFTPGQSFNQIFTTGIPDANHITPTGFEFFINKSNDAATTIYFDNVRVVATAPEPATCTLVGLALVGFVGVFRRRIR